MRPFTNAVFEKEGKSIVGSRWTLDQVHTAYMKADDLLDYINNYKSLKYVNRLGLERIHAGFENGLKNRMVHGLSDKAVQLLSLHVLGELLGKGLDVVTEAAKVYQNSPDTFKALYASSTKDFFRDKYLFQKVPTNSFDPFKTGNNPALSQNIRFSQRCAHLYQDSNPEQNGDIHSWLHTQAGLKLVGETRWLRETIESLNEQQLGQTTRVPLTSVLSKRSLHSN